MPQCNYSYLDQYLNNELLFLLEGHIRVIPINFAWEKLKLQPDCFSSNPSKFSLAARGFTWLTHNCGLGGGCLLSTHDAAHQRRLPMLSDACFHPQPGQKDHRTKRKRMRVTRWLLLRPSSWHTRYHLAQDAPILCVRPIILFKHSHRSNTLNSCGQRCGFRWAVVVTSIVKLYVQLRLIKSACH